VIASCKQGSCGSCRWAIAAGQWSTHAKQSEAARQLLAEILGETVEVDHNDKGAPYLPSHPEWHISISHCRTAVAVAVDGHKPVGIDIESRRKINNSLIERVCTADELAALCDNTDREMTFLQLWTRKEAVLKCRGTGIRGFESVTGALKYNDLQVTDLDCNLPDTVASLALVKDE